MQCGLMSSTLDWLRRVLCADHVLQNAGAITGSLDLTYRPNDKGPGDVGHIVRVLQRLGDQARLHKAVALNYPELPLDRHRLFPRFGFFRIIPASALSCLCFRVHW